MQTELCCPAAEGFQHARHREGLRSPAPAQVGEDADGGHYPASPTLTGWSTRLYSYQWVANDGTTDTDISGETDATYTLLADDEGKTIKVKVTFTDDEGNEEALTSAATGKVQKSGHSLGILTVCTPHWVGDKPLPSTCSIGSRVSVAAGFARVDANLGPADYTLRLDLLDGDGNDADEWEGDNFGETVAFSLGQDDVVAQIIGELNTYGSDPGDYTLVLTVTFGDGRPDRTATVSLSLAEPARNNAATGAPTISSTAQVGEPLTADTSSIADDDGLNNVFYGYQWIRNDGSSDTDITGGTDSSYTLVADDEGKTIKVRVSFTDDAGYAETLTSTATDTVSFATQRQTFNSSATGTPVITGTAQVGGTLTADTTGIADNEGLSNVSYRYQWIRNDGASDADIAGGTDSSYTLVADDVGKTINIRVSFTDDAGNQVACQ